MINRGLYNKMKRLVTEYESAPGFVPITVPPYVSLGGLVLRYIEEDDVYHHDADNWSVGYKITGGGVLVSDISFVPEIHEKELIEITHDEYHHNNNTIPSTKERKLPMYVRLGGTELRYIEEDDEYYRDAGCWSIGYKFIGDVLVSDNSIESQLHEVKLVEITYEEWIEGNRGYIHEDMYWLDREIMDMIEWESSDYDILSYIFDKINVEASYKRFGNIDRFLDIIEMDRYNVNILVGILSFTYLYRDSLHNRNNYYNRLMVWCFDNIPRDEAEQLFNEHKINLRTTISEQNIPESFLVEITYDKWMEYNKVYEKYETI